MCYFVPHFWVFSTFIDGEPVERGVVAIILDHSKYTLGLQSAFVRGDQPRFNMLEKAYESWCVKNNCAKEDLGLEDLVIVESNSTQPSSSVAVVASSSKVVKMSIGGVLSHSLTPLSKFFDVAMRNKSTYVPPTIFDEEWLAIDANALRTRVAKTSCSTDVTIYTGTKVGSEWRQTFMAWMTSYRLMLRYWREVYQGDEGEGLVLAA